MAPALRTVLLAAGILPFLLAGCTGDNRVTIAGQGYEAGTETETLRCGDEAFLAFGVQGAGSLRITVEDGSGAEVYEDGSVGAGQDGESHTLHGEDGTWTLKVSRGLGYAGQYAITLSC